MRRGDFLKAIPALGLLLTGRAWKNWPKWLPARVHVDDLIARQIHKVYVDGKLIEDCYEFDAAEGWANVFVFWETIKLPGGLEGFRHATLHGQIEVEAGTPARRYRYG